MMETKRGAFWVILSPPASLTLSHSLILKYEELVKRFTHGPSFVKVSCLIRSVNCSYSIQTKLSCDCHIVFVWSHKNKKPNHCCQIYIDSVSLNNDLNT